MAGRRRGTGRRFRGTDSSPLYPSPRRAPIFCRDLCMPVFMLLATSVESARFRPPEQVGRTISSGKEVCGVNGRLERPSPFIPHKCRLNTRVRCGPVLAAPPAADLAAPAPGRVRHCVSHEVCEVVPRLSAIGRCTIGGQRYSKMMPGRVAIASSLRVAILGRRE